ncbi:MAG: hypothetical protein Kow001_17570 [Acidobacteriota bacterium]
MKRLQAAILLTLFTGSILVYLWYGRFHYYHRWWIAGTYVLAAAAVLISLRLFPRRSGTWGLSPVFPPGVGPAFGLPTLAGVILILVTARPRGGLSGMVSEALGELPQYLVWAAVQQFLLHHFLRFLSEVLLNGREPAGRRMPVGGALLAAALFASFHWPHPLLVPLTLVAGFVWCLAFVRSSSLVAATLSHIVLAGTLLIVGQGQLLTSFWVGKAGFRFEGYGEGVQVAAGFGPQREPLIVTLPGPDRDVPSVVRVFSPDGRSRAVWTAFPEFGYSGRMAVGELGFGPGDEVAVAPGPGAGNPAMVRIFSLDGRRLAEFEVEELRSGYGAWISVACGGVLMGAGPAPGAAPLVVWTDVTGNILRRWDLGGRVGFVNGIKVWALPGKCPSDGLVVTGSEVSVNPAEFVVVSDRETVAVPAFPATYGLNLIPLEGKDAVVAVSPGPLRGYPRWVRIFEKRLDRWEMLEDFVVPGPEPAAGLTLAVTDLEGGGVQELVVGEGTAPGNPPRVKVIRWPRELLEDWEAW